MRLRIDPCSADDLERLLSADLPEHVAAEHRERFALQIAGAATYLLAWRGHQHVGRATVYADSKYEPVRQAYPRTAEINALDADPRGQGIGTALIGAAETVAKRQGYSTIGLAVEPTNAAARRLYERLGYVPWGRGQVIDEWTEHRDDGSTVDHHDPCDYLIKVLPNADR